MSTEKKSTKSSTVVEIEGEPYVTFKGLKILANALLEDGSCKDINLAVDFIQEVNKQIMKDKHVVVVCSMCAKKVGMKRCAGCPKDSDTRYCSRECQIYAWPFHKSSCMKIHQKPFIG
jgi:hypothetical protein